MADTMTSVSAEAAAADTRMQQTSSTDGGAVYRLQSSSDVPAADAAPSTVASTTADNTTQNAQIHRNQASSQNQFLDATEKPQGVPQTAAAQAPAFTSSTDQHGPSLNTQDGSSSYPDNNNNTNDAQLQLHSTPDPTPSHMHSSSSGPPLLSQNRVAPQTTTVSPDSAPHDLDSYGSPSATSTLAIASDSAHHHHPHHLQQQPSSASDQEPRSPILSPTSTTVPYESAGRRAINSPTAPSTAYPRHDQYPQRQHQQQYPSQSSATDASNPESPPVDASNGGNNSNNNSSFAATSPLPPAQRRPPVTRNSLSIDTLLDAPPPRLRTKRKHGAADAAASSSASASPYPSPNTATDTPPSSAKRTSSQGQRELLLVKSLASAAPDERRASTQRPPVSYKPPAQSSYSHHRQSAGSTGSVVSSAASSASTSPGGTGAVRVPPIRSFRSSGSRKSLNLDTMNYQYYRPRPAPGADSADESGDDPGYHRTLRALEGRNMSDALQNMPTSPTTAVRRAGTFTFGSPSGVGHSASNSNGNDHDDGGDVFLRIAREEGSHRANDLDETQSSVSRVYRSHRRPLSTNVATYQPTSPPYVGRRLSDQRDSSISRVDEGRASEVTRSMTLRGFSSRDHPKAASAHPGELSSSRSTAPITSSLRPSPLAPRTTLAHQDSEGSGSAQTPQRRRSSVTEHIVSPSVRTSTYRSSATATANAGSHGKIYSSSPLTRSFNWQPGSSTANRQGDDTPSHPPISNNNNNNQGPEGTESTTSNTAPSTVWDELDDLKSRIHRLELTGKLPPTSGAAVSRLTEDRPPTATTTATTASSSPKRSREVASQSNGNGANTTTETTGTVVPSQKEAYPVLVSALSKSKPFLNQDIFRALESAATDAMALAGMMGQPGEPGPISGAASAVGGPSPAVTDRQLRRKADSVCRSLTELCVALGEDSAHSSRAYGVVQQQPQQQQPPKTSASSNNDSTAPAPPQLQQPQPPQQQQAPQTSERQYHPSTSSVSQADGPSTPTIHKSFNGLHSRRASITSLALPAKSQLASPTRGPSKFEERRNTILNLGSALPSPRNPVAASTPATPQEPTAARRSSLLVARTRRAVTEEPEDPAATGRKSSLLRTRRAGTEEPEDREQQQPGGGRQTALLRRGRRGTAGEEDESVAAAAAAAVSNFRAPSRAFTEVASSRGPPREYTEVASSTRGPTREYATRDYSHFQNQPLSPTTPLPSTEMPDTNTSQASLALPRRRFVSSSASNMRAAAAGAGTPAGAGAGQGSALPTRKNYGPPPTSMTNLPEAGGRYASLGQTVFPGRTLSTRRYRDGVPRAS